MDQRQVNQQNKEMSQKEIREQMLAESKAASARVAYYAVVPHNGANPDWEGSRMYVDSLYVYYAVDSTLINKLPVNTVYYEVQTKSKQNEMRELTLVELKKILDDRR